MFFITTYHLLTSLQGENLDLAIFKEEVVAMIGDGVCAVKTLTQNHLYCEPPPQQPSPGPPGRRREGADALPEFTVSDVAFLTTYTHLLLAGCDL